MKREITKLLNQIKLLQEKCKHKNTYNLDTGYYPHSRVEINCKDCGHSWYRN